MRKALSVEFRKVRYKKIWMIAGALIGFQLLWLLWNLRRMDAQALNRGWMVCLYQLPVLNAIFMPVLTAVVASRLSDAEHRGRTFKLLGTVMPTGRLFDAKYLCGSFYILSVSLLQLGVLLLTGYVKGFAGPVPMTRMGYQLLFTLCASLTLLLFQQILSLLFVNQLIPLAAGLLGGFAGLFMMYLPEEFSKLTIWGYYGVLMLVGINWDRQTRIVDYYWREPDWTGFILLAAMFLVIYITGRILFTRKEM